MRFSTLRTQQAEEFADEWLELRRRRQDEASLPPDDRLHPRPGAAEPGEPATPQTNPYDTFVGLPLVKAMTAAAARR